jgi:hypothetical protein
MNKTMKKTKESTPFSEPFNKWLNLNVKKLVDLYGTGGVTVMINNQSNKSPRSHNGGHVLFRINYSTPYKTANIWYFKETIELFKKKDFVILRQALTHEVAHILTCPLADLASERFVNHREINDAVESLTESIGQLGRKLLNEKKDNMDKIN